MTQTFKHTNVVARRMSDTFGMLLSLDFFFV